jgi:hypothetical protein
MVKTIKENFITVGVDADMLNVVNDDDGKFVKDAGLHLGGSSGGVRFVTASGKLLGKGHLHGVTKSGIEEALRDWNMLPKSERQPGAVKLGKQGPSDLKHGTAEPLPNGMILKVHGRYLAHGDKGELHKTTLLGDFPNIKQPATSFPGHFEFYTEANPDFMWLTEAEWKSLVPANVKKGDSFALPGALIDRMCWYHLLPNALGSRIGNLWPETGPKGKKGIRAKEVTLTVAAVSPTAIQMTLDGFVHLGNAFDPVAAAWTDPKDCIKGVGYEACLRGRLTYDKAKGAFTCFDMVALGDMYGDASVTNWLYRPGRHPVGFSFELVDGSSPNDRLPPRGYMTKKDLEYYLGKK